MLVKRLTGAYRSAARAAPGKSGLHARGEGERVLALESRVLLLSRFSRVRLFATPCCQLQVEAYKSCAAGSGLLGQLALSVDAGCVENPVDGGTGQTTVHWVTKGRT